MKGKWILVLATLAVVAALLISSTAFASGPARQRDWAGKVKVLVRGAPIHGSNGLYFGPDGKLYIASVMGSEIIKMDPDSGEILDRIGVERGVFTPDDLTFGPDGSLYWTAIMAGEVGKIPPNGTKSTIAKGLPGVNPITFSADGRLFVARVAFGVGLYEMDPNGVNPPRAILPDLANLNGFDFGPDGWLYGPIYTAGGKVVKIDVNAVPARVVDVATGFGMPAAAKFDSRGRLHVVDETTGLVTRIDVRTGKKQVIATLHDGLDNLAFNADDRLFVSNSQDGDIVEVLRNGRARTVSTGGLIGPAGVAVLPGEHGGDRVWVADTWTLRQYAGRSGKLLSQWRAGIFSGKAPPNTVSADGKHVIVTSSLSNVAQVWDPETGQVLESYSVPNLLLNAIRFQGDVIAAELGSLGGQVVNLSKPSDPPIAQLAIPTGMAANGSDLWVADYAQGMVFKVLPGGTLVPVASNLAGPEGLALARDGNLLVVESKAKRLSHIDLATGEVSTVAEGLEFWQVIPGYPPIQFFNGVAVGPSGAIYVTGDGADVLYRITIQP